MKSGINIDNEFPPSFQPPADLLDDDLFGFNKAEGVVNSEGMVVTKYNPKHTNDIMRLSSVNDYTNHIDNVQNDLDSLKDLLSNDSYQLDSNQLLGVSREALKDNSAFPGAFYDPRRRQILISFFLFYVLNKISVVIKFLINISVNS